jgi:hypothetical protein
MARNSEAFRATKFKGREISQNFISTKQKMIEKLVLQDIVGHLCCQVGSHKHKPE